MTAFGTWNSPITPDLVVEKAVGLSQIEVDGDKLYWTELHPGDKGRVRVVQWGGGEMTPKEYNVRTKVHEYGGGAYHIQDGKGLFVDFKSSILYTFEGKKVDDSYAYADFCQRGEHVYAVGQKGDENCLVLIGHGPVATGHDFYASPTISPDGKEIAWITWDHPNMPWDDTDLWTAPIHADGTLGKAQHVAGGKGKSVMYPRFSSEGTLYFITDEYNGWWNIATSTGPLISMEAEFGGPHWIFGVDHFCFYQGRIAAIYAKDGYDHIGLIDPNSGAMETLDLPFVTLSDIHAMDDRLIFNAGSSSEPIGIYAFSKGKLTCLRSSQEVRVDSGYISIPEHISFPTTDGKMAHAFYYAPKNKDATLPENQKPPLIVSSHGGPTAAATASYSLKTQFWTSRGFAVLDVNYGGSTGYGRTYRERLKQNWGIVDVDDCTNGALYLAEKGLVDRSRLFIRGGSAGGYTTLAALTFKDVFAKGASYYGIADIEALVKDTHKFESRYEEGLIGPYPEALNIYHARSPIYHLDKLSCPIILFQGDEDKIVPKEQSEMMYKALVEKGIRTEYHLYKGEQHGFRQAENIKAALVAELSFYLD